MWIYFIFLSLYQIKIFCITNFIIYIKKYLSRPVLACRKALPENAIVVNSRPGLVLLSGVSPSQNPPDEPPPQPLTSSFYLRLSLNLHPFPSTPSASLYLLCRPLPPSLSLPLPLPPSKSLAHPTHHLPTILSLRPPPTLTHSTPPGVALKRLGSSVYQI